MKKNKATILPLVLLSILMTPNAFAQLPDISGMFANGISSFDALTNLIKITSYIIGISLVINSIFKFSQLGQNQQMSPKTPIVMFFCGVGIFALTSGISIVSQSMAMGSGPGALLMPTSGGLGVSTAQALLGVLTFIRLVGYIAFIRGWLLINQAGQGKDGALGRGLTHLFGGVAAINVTITAKILANTFAPGLPMPF